MISVDTNVLVRIVADDPGQLTQVTKAREAALHAEQIYIAQIVQAELVWVLDVAYGLSKDLIIEVLEQLSTNRAYVLQSKSCFQEALSEYRTGKADFSDYLILSESRAVKASLITFDKKLLTARGANPVT